MQSIREFQLPLPTGGSRATRRNEPSASRGPLAGPVGTFDFQWTGLSYEERLSGSQAPALYAISLMMVFLCLAALYESWSVPSYYDVGIGFTSGAANAIAASEATTRR
jgi:multidrug efflux pump subunit AcrB